VLRLVRLSTSGGRKLNTVRWSFDAARRLVVSGGRKFDTVRWNFNAARRCVVWGVKPIHHCWS
jgi:hypothetical protein